MITHRIEPVPSDGEAPIRDSIGGRPILPGGVDWPACECGERMVLFLQLDVRPEFALPFEPGSHLSVFMCPVHNDAPEILSGSQLPPAFWGRRRRIDGQVRFYELFLHGPGAPEAVHPPDPFLQPHHLQFRRDDEPPAEEDHAAGIEGLKVGGRPSWAQDPVQYRCCCGAEMAFLCQVPLDHPFPKQPSAPAQPDSFSADDYCLFLGNETYVFACAARCDPRAVHPVVQN